MARNTAKQIALYSALFQVGFGIVLKWLWGGFLGLQVQRRKNESRGSTSIQFCTIFAKDESGHSRFWLMRRAKENEFKGNSSIQFWSFSFVRPGRRRRRKQVHGKSVNSFLLATCAGGIGHSCFLLLLGGGKGFRENPQTYILRFLHRVGACMIDFGCSWVVHEVSLFAFVNMFFVCECVVFVCLPIWLTCSRWGFVIES